MQIGDKVRFINEALDGTVTRLIDAKTVGVSIEEGFEIPVLIRELMITTPANPVEEHDKKVAGNIKKLESNSGEISVLFEESSQGWYRAQLVNHSEHDILLSVANQSGNRFKALFAGRIESKRAILFNTLQLANIELWGTYCFRIIFHESSSEVPRAPWYIEYTFKSKDFKSPVQLEGKQAFIVSLRPAKIEQFTLKEPITIETRSMPEVKEIHRPEEIIDLHIHKLIENYREMSAEEALSLQMRHFQNLFEKAMALDYEKITVIHGVGSGALKQKIWKVVSGNPHVRTFNEAQKEKFGYGATEIYFK